MSRSIHRARHCRHSKFDRHSRRAGYGAALDQTYAGTGNGTLVVQSVDPAAVDAEIWTITFSNATTFAVSGSVAGAQTGGTVGTVYTSDAGEMSFLVTAGGTPFVNLDAFTFQAETQGAYQAALNPSDRIRYAQDQTNRLGDVDPVEGNSVEDALCADGTSSQTPLGRSHQYTFEDVDVATGAADIGLT